MEDKIYNVLVNHFGWQRKKSIDKACSELFALHEAEIAKLKPYLRHLNSCTLKQDWAEALQAMSDTQMKFRDESYQQALNEIYHKMNNCSYGLVELENELNLKTEQ